MRDYATNQEYLMVCKSPSFIQPKTPQNSKCFAECGMENHNIQLYLIYPIQI